VAYPCNLSLVRRRTSAPRG